VQWEQLQQYCINYKKVLFVDVNNVTSKQISELRRDLRAIDAHVFMGKNTHMKGAINELMEKPEPGCKNYEKRVARWQERPHLNLILKQLVGNVGMIFTNGDLSVVKGELDKQARGAPAKAGQIAPSDVTIQPGPTGMDPKQTSFFQALNILTKIVKAQIEIVNPVKVIKEGDKVNQSQAALLEKLKITPFEYKMHILKVLDGGKIYPPSVLNIKTDDLLAAFKIAGGNLTATSLSSGYVVPSAAPHLIMNAFKNLCCASFASGYDFPQAAVLKAGSGPAPTAAAAATTTAAPVAAAKEEAKPADEEMDVGGMDDLFGGGDY